MGWIWGEGGDWGFEATNKSQGRVGQPDVGRGVAKFRQSAFGEGPL
jgi:hypothetical protein